MAQAHNHTILATVPAIFDNDFQTRDQDMRNLYEKAKRDQWNASTDINWERDFNPENGVLPEGLIDIYGTKYWERMSRAEHTRVEPPFFRLAYQSTHVWRAVRHVGVQPVGEHSADDRFQVFHGYSSSGRSASCGSALALRP